MQRNTKYEKMLLKEIRNLPESRIYMVLRFVQLIGSKKYEDSLKKKVNKLLKNKERSFAGVLNRYADITKISQEKERAWKLVAKERK